MQAKDGGSSAEQPDGLIDEVRHIRELTAEILRRTAAPATGQVAGGGFGVTSGEMALIMHRLERLERRFELLARRDCCRSATGRRLRSWRWRRRS